MAGSGACWGLAPVRYGLGGKRFTLPSAPCWMLLPLPGHTCWFQGVWFAVLTWLLAHSLGGLEWLTRLPCWGGLCRPVLGHLEPIFPYPHFQVHFVTKTLKHLHSHWTLSLTLTHCTTPTRRIYLCIFFIFWVLVAVWLFF